MGTFIEAQLTFFVNKRQSITLGIIIAKPNDLHKNQSTLFLFLLGKILLETCKKRHIFPTC